MPTIQNHSCYPESSGINCLPIQIGIGGCCLFQKIFNQIFKSRIVLRRETALKDWTEAQPFLLEQTEIALRAADVPGQNHFVRSFSRASRWMQTHKKLNDERSQ
jgi:hypothetical protein